MKTDKIFIIIIVATFTVSPAVIPVSAAQSPPEFKTYTNSSYGITMQYPGDFILLGAGPQSIVYFTSPTGKASVFISPTGLINSSMGVSNYNATLEQYYSSVVSTFNQTLPNFQVLPGWPQNTTFGGHHAISVQYTYTGADGQPIEAWAVMALHNNTAYRLTYVSPVPYFNDYISNVGKMAATLQFLSTK
jgi:hypothetical protein